MSVYLSPDNQECVLWTNSLQSKGEGELKRRADQPSLHTLKAVLFEESTMTKSGFRVKGNKSPGWRLHRCKQTNISKLRFCPGTSTCMWASHVRDNTSFLWERDKTSHQCISFWAWFLFWTVSPFTTSRFVFVRTPPKSYGPTGHVQTWEFNCRNVNMTWFGDIVQTLLHHVVILYWRYILLTSI